MPVINLVCTVLHCEMEHDRRPVVARLINFDTYLLGRDPDGNVVQAYTSLVEVDGLVQLGSLLKSDMDAMSYYEGKRTREHVDLGALKSLGVDPKSVRDEDGHCPWKYVD